MIPPLFDEDFLRRIESLQLVLRRRPSGVSPGERPLEVHGQSHDFTAHRPYIQGDEFRRIDWNVFARLGQLVVKDFARERAAAVHFILDGSPSMQFGSPTKFNCARRLAGALGAVALATYDRVFLSTFAEGTPRDCGGTSPKALFDAVQSLAAHEPVELGPALSATLAQVIPRSVVFVLTDLWSEDRDALGRCAAVMADLSMIHVLSREEMDPPFQGRTRFRDSETGREIERFIGAEERARYGQFLETHRSLWKAACFRRSAHYLPVVSDMEILNIVMVCLQRAGVLA